MEGLNINKLFPWGRAGLMLLGLAGLAALVLYYGTASVGGQIGGVGASLVLVLVLSFFQSFFRTIAWQAALNEPAPFWSLFGIYVGGASLNLLLPFSLIGGDPIRLAQLRKKHKIVDGSAGIVTDRAVFTLAVVLFSAFGLIVGVLASPLFGSAVRVVVPLLLLAGAALFLVARRGPGLLSGFLRVVQGWRLISLSPAVLGGIEESERHLDAYSRQRPGAFFQSLLLHLAALGLLVAEIYVIGRALDPAFPPALALALAALTPVIRGLFSFIPGTFGVLEVLIALVTTAVLGPGTAILGLTIVLVQRLRALIWIVIGLAMTGNPFKLLLAK